MSQQFDIVVNDTHVGAIEVNDEVERLLAHRTIEGFHLSLPAKVTLRGSSGSSATEFGHMIRNIEGTIYMNSGSESHMEVGRVSNPWFYVGTPECSRNISLFWTGTSKTLAFIEKARNGKSPHFEVWLQGEYCRLFPSDIPHLGIPSEPTEFHGFARISYPIELWTSSLRELGISENVLVEIPLPTSPPAPWDEVWKALIEARDAFEKGGSTGWKGCVTGVRLALERWQKIEKEEMGPGSSSPSRIDRESRTKQQRFDNLRWHLLQCAHLGPHSSAEDWSRDEALLLLSTLSALLAERKP